MRIQRTYIQDPGHGWLKVSRSEIAQNGLADLVSQYSYIEGNYVYLEEDQDMGMYLKYMKDRGIEVDLVEKYEEYTQIRNMKFFEPQDAIWN